MEPHHEIVHHAADPGQVAVEDVGNPGQVGGRLRERDDVGIALDHEHLAELLVVDDLRCAVAEGGIDVVDVGVRRLGDLDLQRGGVPGHGGG